jgi:hypothetical protein
MDPATIGLLISIAGTVLDLLFGQGYHTLNVQDVQEKLRQMYGYGLEGYGMYGEGEGYPRRRRVVETAFALPETKQAYFRAAIFNKALAEKNPWVEFLRKKGFYKEMREKLQEYREAYRQQNHSL